MKRAWFALAAVLAAAPEVYAAGGDIDLQAFRPAMDSRGYVTANASDVLGHRELSFGLVTTWGHGVLDLAQGTMRYRVADIVTPTLQAAFGWGGRLELGASVPFRIVDGDAQAQGVGDVGGHLKLRLLDTSHHAVGIALVGAVYLPGGYDAGAWMGEDGVTWQPSLVVDRERGPLSLALNVGVRLRDGTRAFVDPSTGMRVAVGTELPFVAAGSFALAPGRVALVGELLGSVPLDAERYQPLEAVAAFKVYLARSSFFEVGGGLGLVSAAGSPSARAFLGIVFEPSVGDRDGDGLKDDVDRCPDDPEDRDDFQDADGCPELDNDRDGIVDEDDGCPHEPEDKDGVEDRDGCPDHDTLDRDGDRITDDVDRCPDDPEDVDAFQDADGCPDLDNDRDRIVDGDDLCPNDPEDHDRFQDADGCPDPDNDRDRIVDTDDGCPNEPETPNHYKDEDGCPDRKIAVDVGTHIEVVDKIWFETDKATIKAVSKPTLDAVAQLLLDNPDILLVEVQGHADERGSDEHNDELTQARAEAVKAYLEDRGVDAKRLVAKGYGERVPIEKGHGAKAWSANRRVEFVVKKRSDR